MDADCAILDPDLVDRAGNCSRALGDPGAFESRAGSGGGDVKRAVFPEREFSVGADVCKKGDLLPVAHAGEQYAGGRIGADKCVHAGREIRGYAEDVFGPAEEVVRFEGRAGKRRRILAQKKIQHRRVADDDGFFDQGRFRDDIQNEFLQKRALPFHGSLDAAQNI